MDDLVTYGVLAVVLFYIIIAGIAGGVLYGLSILINALITGDYTPVVQSLLAVIILASAYSGAGLLLAKLGII
jgi:hypothetical protein